MRYCPKTAKEGETSNRIIRTDRKREPFRDKLARLFPVSWRDTGVTAAILSLALERLGHRNHSLYDGSWAEWGMYEDLAVEQGPAR